MAVKTYYFKNAVAAGSTAHRSLQDGGTAPTAATTTTGWVCGTNAIGQCCIQNGGVEIGRSDGQWGTNKQPFGTDRPTTARGDAWRSENTLNGTFANSPYVFTFGIRSVTAAFTGRLILAIKIYADADPGTVAAASFGPRVASAATTANLSTTADTTVSISSSPGGKVLTNQYLYVQVGIEITAAGGGTTQDVDFRVGSAYTLVTPDFTVPGAGFRHSFATLTG